MKRYVNIQNQIHKVHSDTFELKVIIDFEEISCPITSSTIKPIQPDYPVDTSIDEQALADYDCFIANSKEELEDLGLEIKYSNDSNKSPASRYFTLVDLEQDVMHTMKYMIFLRISDHHSSNSVDTDKLIKEHWDRVQQNVSLEQGHKVKWKLRQIIVNNQTFDDYDEAIDYIRSKAEEWLNTLHSRSY